MILTSILEISLFPQPVTSMTSSVHERNEGEWKTVPRKAIQYSFLKIMKTVNISPNSAEHILLIETAAFNPG